MRNKVFVCLLLFGVPLILRTPSKENFRTRRTQERVLNFLLNFQLNVFSFVLPWRRAFSKIGQVRNISERAEVQKINRICSNHRHKIRFQDIVYSYLNKWRAKKLGKKCQQKELNWMYKTDQKTRNYIMLFCATKCSKVAEKIKYAKLS